MPTGTVLSDYQLDEACLITGRRIENRLSEGKPAFGDAEKPAVGNQMQSLRSRARIVKIKEDGTW